MSAYSSSGRLDVMRCTVVECEAIHESDYRIRLIALGEGFEEQFSPDEDSNRKPVFKNRNHPKRRLVVKLRAVKISKQKCML